MERILIGEIFKSLVAVIFEEAGYEVYPYSRESLSGSLKGQVTRVTDAATGERVRSTPDLLVFDRSENRTYLAEIKHRKFLDPELPAKVDVYRRHWPDSILVFVMKDRPHFLAQVVEKIPSGELNAEDFERLDQLFSKIAWDAEVEARWNKWVERLADLWSSFKQP